MAYKKISSDAGGATPSTGQQLVDAFNGNFDDVEQNKANRNMSNVDVQTTIGDQLGVKKINSETTMAGEYQSVVAIETSDDGDRGASIGVTSLGEAFVTEGHFDEVNWTDRKPLALADLSNVTTQSVTENVFQLEPNQTTFVETGTKSTFGPYSSFIGHLKRLSIIREEAVISDHDLTNRKPLLFSDLSNSPLIGFSRDGINLGNNSINGTFYYIIGSFNQINSSEKNIVIGDSNLCGGNNNIIMGISNTVNSSNCIVMGKFINTFMNNAVYTSFGSRTCLDTFLTYSDLNSLTRVDIDGNMGLDISSLLSVSFKSVDLEIYATHSKADDTPAGGQEYYCGIKGLPMGSESTQFITIQKKGFKTCTIREKAEKKILVFNDSAGFTTLFRTSWAKFTMIY